MKSSLILNDLTCIDHAYTAKYARFKEFQEVLKLKGKPLNSARATAIKMAENESIRNILVAIGYDAEKSAKTGKAVARVNHIYILSV
jgi:DNA gyrase/topoisomerase IV subunit B